MNILKTYYKSPVGWLEIIATDKYLLAINFKKSKGQNQTSAFLRKTTKQLDEYFQGTRKKFDLAIKLTGTPWQIKVWQELSRVPYGTVVSYRDLMGSKYARAVGNAVNKNKIPIIIPCHRVVGADGSLTGYAGGLWRKKRLLELENTSLDRI